MEGLRDAALADYENLPDEEKAKIHDDFKQMIATSGVSLFIEFSREFYPQIVDEFLQNCEGHEEGRLDFNGYITVKYVVEKHDRVICNGCSSLILRRPYFSCYECFFQDSYDLCSGCYRSKKFKDHYHEEFYDNDKLLRLCRRMVVEKQEDNNRINRAAIEFADKCLDFARSITTDRSEDNLDRVLNFDKNEKLGRDSKEPEENEEEEDENSALPMPKLDGQKVRRLTDLFGVKPSVQTQPTINRYD